MRLPDTWTEVRLGNICQINPNLPRKERPLAESLVSFVPMASVDEVSGIVARLETKTYAEVAKGYTSFKQGDVLFAKVTPCMENGKAAIAPDLDTGLGFGSTEFHVLRPCPELRPEFLYHFIRQPFFRLIAASAFVGSGGLQRVPPDFLARFKFPLPTIPEQQRIVAILQQTETIKAHRSRASNLFRQLARERFYELFGHPAENPNGYDSLLFSELGTLDRGISKHRPRDAAHLYGGQYPFIQTGVVSNAGDWITSYSSTYSEAGLKQSKLWPKGTLCITIAANIARAAILDFDACFPDSVVGFTPFEGVYSEYVLYCVRFYQEYFEQRAPKSAQMNINLDKLRRLRIPKPPEKMQKQFAEFVTQLRTISDGIQLQAEKNEELKRELCLAAFSGELTAKWREENIEALRKEASSKMIKRNAGRPFKTQISIVEHVRPHREQNLLEPKRGWLIEQLSEFQNNVRWSLYEYKGTLIADDPEVLERFCEQWPVASDAHLHDRIRRALDQLASLGLIAKVSLRSPDDEGKVRFLIGYRFLRDEERECQVNDINRLEKLLEEMAE